MEKNYPFCKIKARNGSRTGLAGQNEKRVRQPWRLIFATLVPVVLFAVKKIFT
jgi:hypothetical protein